MNTQSDSDSPTLASQFELVTKIGAAVLGFAYVSGYLIVNTYLSSFGINTDAIQVFKSKYVYVGFFYALMLSIVVLVFALVKKVFDLRSASTLVETRHTAVKPTPETGNAESAGVISAAMTVETAERRDISMLWLRVGSPPATPPTHGIIAMSLSSRSTEPLPQPTATTTLTTAFF